MKMYFPTTVPKVTLYDLKPHRKTAVFCLATKHFFFACSVLLSRSLK